MCLCCSYLQVQLVLTHNYKERKGAKGAQLTVPSVMLHWGNNQFAQKIFITKCFRKKSLNNKQCFTDNPLFYLTSEKKPVVYILSLGKKCTGFPQSFTFLQSEGSHSKTSSSPRIGTGQEGGALVTRGCLSHTHPLGGEPMVPLSLAAKEGGSPSIHL